MLKVESIHVFSKEKVLVQSASFTVAKKDIVYIEGSNGSGKSSLFRGLFGHPHVQVDNKKISLDGTDISLASPQELASLGLLYVPQHAVVLSGVSFISFMHRGYELVHKKTISILDFTKMCKEKCFMYGMPEYVIEKNIHEHLSGGERKLQELAQVIILEPKIAFVDEIDAGLDQEKQLLVARVLQQMASRGMGVVYTSHNATFTHLLPYTQKYIMDKGILKQEI